MQAPRGLAHQVPARLSGGLRLCGKKSWEEVWFVMCGGGLVIQASSCVAHGDGWLRVIDSGLLSSTPRSTPRFTPRFTPALSPRQMNKLYSVEVRGRRVPIREHSFLDNPRTSEGVKVWNGRCGGREGAAWRVRRYGGPGLFQSAPLTLYICIRNHSRQRPLLRLCREGR